MGKLSKTLPIVVLGVLCAVIVFSRLHTYDEPLERDLTTYAVIAHEMLAGKALYREVWDHKPPAIHVTYAAAELIAGYGRDSIFLMNVAAAIATLFACYWAGSAAGGQWVGGCSAAALWAFASSGLAIQGNQPNTEVFLNICLSTGFAILVRAGEGSLGVRNAIVAGLLFAVASLYKQIVVVQAVLLVIAYCACCPANLRKRAVADGVIIGMTGLVSWVLVFAYFFARGSGSAFIEAVFTYNRYYSSSASLHDLGYKMVSAGASPAVFAVTLSMASLSLVGAVHGLSLGPRRHWILLGAFALATHIAVLLPGWFFSHYYQLWLPPLAIGAGWTVALLKRVLAVELSSLAYFAGFAVCGVVIGVQLPDYLIPAQAWSSKKYGNIFLETDDLACKFDNMLSPAETFYEWGNESGLYFTSRRRPPSGIIFAFPMLAGPLKAKLSARLIDDLNRAKPDLIVANIPTMALTQRGHPVLNWFKENYRTFARTDEFLFLARKGSRLDGHAGAPPAN